MLVVIYQSVTPVLSCTLRYCENDALFFNHFSRHFNVVSRLGRNENKIIIGRQYEYSRNKSTISFFFFKESNFNLFLKLLVLDASSYWGRVVFKSAFGGLIASLVTLTLFYGLLSCCGCASQGNFN